MKIRVPHRGVREDCVKNIKVSRKVITETKMTRVQWKTFRTMGLLAGLFILYLSIRVQNYQHKAFVFLPTIHPNEPWEFVADFSNMKYLNPTIVDFDIIEEKGNYDHWKYSTEYSEKLSHWPYLPNTAVAHFDIKGDAKTHTYYINSVHRTCLFMGLYCLDSGSEFKFMNSNSSHGALCEESVQYQCPSILSSFCRREVVYQRTAIMNNLKKKFSQGKH